MTTAKDGPACTVVGQHNMTGLVMEDLPEVERATLEKEL
jgi:hypothetical protein